MRRIGSFSRKMRVRRLVERTALTQQFTAAIPQWIEALEGRLLLSAVQPHLTTAKIHVAPPPAHHKPVAPPKPTAPPSAPVVAAPPPGRTVGSPPARGQSHQPSPGSYGYGKDPNDNELFPGIDDGGNGGEVLAYPGPTELPSDITDPTLPKLATVGGTWNSVGPAPILNGSTAFSGRIVGIAASPTDSNTILIAAAGGGVWKTTNGGASWASLTDSQSTTVMGAIAIAPSNSSVIYAGTGEPDNSIDSYYGRGILKSTDGGTTWALMGGNTFLRHTISRIVVDPTNLNVVYVAVAGGGVNGFGGNTGIYKTTDGGATWTNMTAASGLTSNATYSDLAMSPSNSQVLYCSIGTFFGDTSNGMYESTNAGVTWTQLANFPVNGTSAGRISFSIAPTNGQVIYAQVSHPTNYSVVGVFKSTNGGATWGTVTPTSSGQTVNYMGGQGWYDQPIAVSPSDANIVYVAGSAGTNAVMKTSDGGITWTAINNGTTGSPHPDHHALVFDAGGRLLDGNDGGIWRLDNPNVGSIVWTDINANLQLTQFVGIGISNTDATIAFGGSQDNGTSQLNPGASTFTLREGGDGGDVFVSPNAFSRVYHIAPIGSFGRADFFRRSDNGGVNWSSFVNGIGTSDGSNFYPPFAVDPNSYGGFDRLLLGMDHLYESTDNGTTWTAIGSPGINGFNTTTTGNPLSIDAIAFAPSNFNTIYASAGGRTFITTNNGASWTQINVSGATDHVSQIVVDPTNSQVAYAVRDRFGGSKVFRTTNGGATWTSITGNLPDVPAFSIVLDANGPGTGDDVLYIGTDSGVYTSPDLGTTWNQLGVGLPTTSVHSLQLNQQNVLMAGTYGRGMWRISVGAPTDNVIATQDGAEIHLRWAQDNTGGGTGFAIQRSVDGGAFSALTTISGLTQTTYTDATAVAGHTYQYQVQMTFTGASSAFAQSNSLAFAAQGDVDHEGGFIDATDLTLNGAKITAGGALQLPDGQNSESRTAFLTLGSGAITNFYTEFNFKFINPGADGLTFTIQPNAPTQVGNAGGDMGYGGILNSVSIFFNMYSNVTETGMFTAGSTSGTHFAMTSLGNAFHVLDGNSSTDIFHVALSYNSGTHVLSESVIDTGNSNTFNTSYSVNLGTILGDQSAYVGFTGGTGGLNSTQQVTSWWWSPTGHTAPFQLNGTPAADTIYLKADPDNLNVDYWLNKTVGAANTASGKFAKTFSGVDIHGLGSADVVTLDESAGDVILGQDWLDDIGAGGAATVKIIGSTGNDTYLMDPTGTKLTYANNGASIASGKIMNLANVAALSFSGNGGADTITSAGAIPFTATLASTGSENVTVNSGTTTIILPLTNDNVTINNVGGTVNIQISAAGGPVAQQGTDAATMSPVLLADPSANLNPLDQIVVRQV